MIAAIIPSQLYDWITASMLLCKDMPAGNGSAGKGNTAMSQALKIARTASRVQVTPMSALDKIMAALNEKPQAKESALHVMVRQVCQKNGKDYDKLSAGEKAAITRKVKAAAIAAGVTLARAGANRHLRPIEFAT